MQGPQGLQGGKRGKFQLAGLPDAMLGALVYFKAGSSSGRSCPLLSRGHVATSGDICGCHSWDEWGRGGSCRPTVPTGRLDVRSPEREGLGVRGAS